MTRDNILKADKVLDELRGRRAICLCKREHDYADI